MADAGKLDPMCVKALEMERDEVELVRQRHREDA
jgi:hypothetical protein